jgi:hypothetical protein
MEEPGSFRLGELTVCVQPDFACRDGDSLLTYAWMTGEADAAPTGEILACHVLYACETWRAAPERVIAHAFDLGANKVFEHRLTQADLDEARSRILASAGAMKAFLDEPEAGEARFPLAADDRPCGACSFRRVCPRFASAAGPSLPG